MAWIQEQGKVWWIGWRDSSGRQVRKSLKTTDKATAQAELDKIRALIAANKASAITSEFISVITGKPVATTPLLSEFLAAWLKESEIETSAGTMLKYRQVVKEFIPAVNADSLPMRVGDVTPEQVTQFLSDKAGTSSRETAGGFRKILRSIFIKAQDMGYISRIPVPKASRRRGMALDKARKRPFTTIEIKDLFDRANPFWRYMIVAGYYTGQRMGDLIMLKRANVNLARNEIQIRSRKTDTRVSPPIAKRLRDLLVSIWPKSDDDYFWPEQANRYRKIGASAFSQEFYALMASVGLVAERGPKHKSKQVGRNTTRSEAALGFHNLRHNFVTGLKSAGVSDSVARELAGHSSNLISDTYTHMPSEVLQKAILALPEVTL